MLCAVPLSSSISKTRTSRPQPFLCRRRQSHRRCVFHSRRMRRPRPAERNSLKTTNHSGLTVTSPRKASARYREYPQRHYENSLRSRRTDGKQRRSSHDRARFNGRDDIQRRDWLLARRLRERAYHPRASFCAPANHCRWFLRTCAGARLSTRTTSSAIALASAPRPSFCSNWACRTRGSTPGKY